MDAAFGFLFSLEILFAKFVYQQSVAHVCIDMYDLNKKLIRQKYAGNEKFVQSSFESFIFLQDKYLCVQ